MTRTTNTQQELSPLKRAFLKIEELERKLKSARDSAAREPIAIVGMACRFPGDCDTPEKFWQLLRDGREAVGEIPKERWDVDAFYDPDPNAPGKMSTRRGAFLKNVDHFDPQFFGISPREAMSLDPQQRLLLETAWEALENAGQAPDQLKKTLTGVFLAMCKTDYAQLLLAANDPIFLDTYYASGNAYSTAAGRIAYILGLEGACLTVDTACSSSLVATHLACRSLRAKESNMALVGGVNLVLSPENTITFSKSSMLAADGRCKTFDASADGFGQGEGCAVMALKRLSDAQKDGDPIVAVIRGTALNQDGASSGLTAPNGASQQAVIHAALRDAGLRPQDIDYVETHGTGTSLGDPIEVQALGAALGKGRSKENPLLLGAVKTNVGHLEACAGIAGLFKLALSLRNRQLPASLHFNKPNPFIPWQKLPVKVVTELTDWQTANGKRRGGLSAFGFSGTNAHVIVEEYVEDARVENTPSRPVRVLTLSAFDKTALAQQVERFSEFLGSDMEFIPKRLDVLGDDDAQSTLKRELRTFANICFSANTGRADLGHRIAIQAKDLDDLKNKFSKLRNGETPEGAARGVLESPDKPKLAFLFTGQGSQYAGMGRELYETEPVFRRALDRCAEILKDELDVPLLEVVFAQDYTPLEGGKGGVKERSHEAIFVDRGRFLHPPSPPEGGNSLGGNDDVSGSGDAPLPTPGPSQEGNSANASRPGDLINQTAYTQPALFAIEYALARLWLSWGVRPDAVMGHSVGEYVAACVAGIFSLQDGLKLIAARGRLMQNLPQDGAMVAVFAAEKIVREALVGFEDRVSVAALNGAENTVISGERGAIAEITKHFDEKGIKHKALTVSHAFHSPLMTPILDEFEKIASGIEFLPPKIGLVSNLTGKMELSRTFADPKYWRRHIREAVRFLPSMRFLEAKGYRHFLEIGPHPTLCGMGAGCVENPCEWTPSLRRGRGEARTILAAVQALFVEGFSIDWQGFYRHEKHRKVRLPNYPFNRKRYWYTSLSPGARNGAARNLSVGADQNAHPILGKRLRLPALTDILFESRISLAAAPFVADHKVHGAIVLPGAAFFEMLASAADEIFGAGAHAIEDLDLREALVLDEKSQRTLQVILSPENDDGLPRNPEQEKVDAFEKKERSVTPPLPPSRGELAGASRSVSFQIISFEMTQNGDSREWTIHAAGRILDSRLRGNDTEGGTDTERGTDTVGGDVSERTKVAATSENIPLTPFEGGMTGEPAARAMDSRLRGNDTEGGNDVLAELRESLTQEVSREAFYDDLHERGLEFGDLFHGVQKVWREDGQALAEVHLPEALVFEKSRYKMHPVLLDACLQIIGTATHGWGGENDAKDVYMPLGAGRISIFDPPRETTVFSHATLESGDVKGGDTMTATVRIYDETGAPVALVERLQLKRVTAGQLRQSMRANYDEWFYHVEWQEKPLAERPQMQRVDFVPNSAKLAEIMLPELQNRTDEFGMRRYDDLLPRLDQLGFTYIVQSFQTWGFSFSAGQKFTEDEAAQACGIVGQHRRLFVRLLEILAEEGVLAREDDRWITLKSPEIAAPKTLAGEIAEAYSADQPELIFIQRGGEKLAEVLRGEYDPLQVLFPGGSHEIADRLYQESPGAKVYNSVAKRALVEVIANLPHDRKIRVLEVGAGTGGTTSFILEAFPPERTEYVFTDLGAAFLAKAREKFGKFDFVEYKVLDIERDPLAQGFESQSFDLVVSANCVHATRDLTETLAHIRQLMAPSGLLMLIEGIQPQRWIDLTFGLTEGWWRFTDTEVRPDYPLIGHREWLDLFGKLGFEDVETIPGENVSSRALLQNAIHVARAPKILPLKGRLPQKFISRDDRSSLFLRSKPTPGPSPEGNWASASRSSEISSGGGLVGGKWLVFADENGAGEALVERLKNDREEEAVLVFPGGGFKREKGNRFWIDPANGEHYRRVVDEVFVNSQIACEGVVHLWALDAERGNENALSSESFPRRRLRGDKLRRESISSVAPKDSRLRGNDARGGNDTEHGNDVAGSDENEILNAQNMSSRGVLHLVQALGRADVAPPVWLVTQQAQGVIPGDAVGGFSAATLWGMGKVITMEHPELLCVRLDLAEAPAERQAAQIFAEIGAGDDENQIAWREGKRFVARLARSDFKKEKQREEERPEDHPVQLEVKTPGILDDLAFTPQTRRFPNPDEIEIRVYATGLNFRDVLNALGMRDDDDPLGGEVSGTVTRVGENVRDLEVGDAVVAVTSGGFSTFVNASQTLALKKPEHLSFEDAATLPLAFLTAHYALFHFGKLQKGERILIHAAAGGVGMAAVQLARRAGAEIFATAGSPEKREFLKSLGIQHVMNSRTLDFAEEIMQITGGEGVDLVLNALTEDFIPKSLGLLREGGRFLEIGKKEIWDDARVAGVNPKARYFAVDLAEKIITDPAAVRPLFMEILHRLGEGDLRPLHKHVFAFEKAPEAFRFMAQARHMGKVVVSQLSPLRREAGGDVSERTEHATTSENIPRTPFEGGMTGAPSARCEFRAEATYLITGGMKGIGLLVAEWMVAKGARGLVLTGRSAPDEHAEEIIAKLIGQGAEVRTAQGDVADSRHVAEVMALIEDELPPLKGVFHSAGVLADGVLLQQDWERYLKVYGAKVRGAWHLHRHTQALDLDFFVLFSSISGLLGSSGQSNHAAANAFMDSLCAFRRARGLPAMSINWGVWSEIGAAARHGVDARAALQGMQSFSPGQGLDTLEILMKNQPVQCAVMPVFWPKLLQTFNRPKERAFFERLAAESRRQSAAAEAPVRREENIREKLENATPARRGKMLQAFVEQKVLKVLALEDDHEVGEKQPLTDMGLDSLMAVELRNLLGAGLGLKRALPATLVFDYPTTSAMTRFLEKELFGDTKKDVVDEISAKEPAGALDMLDQLESLSDDEIDLLFAEKAK